MEAHVTLVSAVPEGITVGRELLLIRCAVWDVQVIQNLIISLRRLVGSADDTPTFTFPVLNFILSQILGTLESNRFFQYILHRT